MSAPCLTSPIKFQLRRDTSSNWTAANPILYAGEPGVETNTGQIKVGDGARNWNALPYVGYGGATGPTGPFGSGPATASSYGYSQNLPIPNDQTTLFPFDTTYVERGTHLAANSLGALTRIVVDSAGIYEIITSIQVNNTNTSPTNAFTWIKINGVDVPDSNGGLLIPPSASAASLIAVPYMASLAIGDYVEIAITTPSANVAAVGFVQNLYGATPAGPAIAVNIKKVAIDIGTTGPTGPSSTVLGPTGVTGPTGAYAPVPVAMLAYVTNDNQSLPLGLDELVRFNTVDAVNTVGTTGFVLSGSNYIFTNTKSVSVPVLLDWYINFTGYTGATVVYTYAGIYIDAFTAPTYRQGEMYSQISVGSSAFVASTAIINVPASASVGFYVNSSATATISGGNSYMTLVPLTGFDGPTGSIGPTGVVGPTGVRGPIGFTFTGPTGSTGRPGYGATGPQGTEGFQGNQGIQGEQGNTGPQGAQGFQGQPGPQGDTGPQGVQGIQGIEGPTGPGGSSWSVYPAISTVNLSNFLLSNVTGFSIHGGLTITDTTSGGTGTLTVGADNGLYWNGNLIA